MLHELDPAGAEPPAEVPRVLPHAGPLRDGGAAGQNQNLAGCQGCHCGQCGSAGVPPGPGWGRRRRHRRRRGRRWDRRGAGRGQESGCGQQQGVSLVLAPAHVAVPRAAHTLQGHVVRPLFAGVALCHAALGVEPDPGVPRLRPAGRTGVPMRAAGQGAAGARVQRQQAPHPYAHHPAEALQAGAEGAQHHLPRPAAQPGEFTFPGISSH